MDRRPMDPTGRTRRQRARLWSARAGLVVGAPLLLFAAVELVAWAAGVEPMVESKHYQRRDQIVECRWQPAHLEQAAGRDLPPPESDAHRAAYVRRALATEGDVSPGTAGDDESERP